MLVIKDSAALKRYLEQQKASVEVLVKRTRESGRVSDSALGQSYAYHLAIEAVEALMRAEEEAKRPIRVVDGDEVDE